MYARRSDCLGGGGTGFGAATGLMAVRTGDGAGTTGAGCGDISTVARARCGGCCGCCHGGRAWTGVVVLVGGGVGVGVGDSTMSA